jgi:hypothetical protein
MEDSTRLHTLHELAGQIYADRRMTPAAREVALAMAWLTNAGNSPENNPRSHAFWDRLTGLLGPGDYRGSRVAILLADDAPRYVPPRQVLMNRGACVGPRARPSRPRIQPSNDVDCMVYVSRDYAEPPTLDANLCGANATIKVVEHDPRTGWQHAHWFCRRHADRAAEVRAQLAHVDTPPRPVPNTGGLLPCYFDADWTEIYAHYRPGWQPPYHGIRADQWPAPESSRIPQPPRLAVVTR